MIRGLVIGKFMPIHQGHIALIEFAASRCNELIVSMSYTSSDPIDPKLRFEWLKEIFKGDKRIKPFMIEDDFDDPSLTLSERTKIWSDYIRKIYPPVDVLFSSEQYGQPFANHLNAVHQSFDPDREKYPVSGTQIRADPFQYWNFIPPVVRPYFVKKICFYGPESTGKTMLAQKMAEVYKTEFVPEVARELITSNDFTTEDIVRIGYAQLERIKAKSKTTNKILLCDTDTITTQIYSQHYLGCIPDVLYELEKTVQYDLYFLMDIDVPWIADGLRDLGHDRKKMFSIFKNELIRRDIPFILVHGDYAEREKIVCREINRLLNLNY